MRTNVYSHHFVDVKDVETTDITHNYTETFSEKAISPDLKAIHNR
jgi:hypothetical protein